MDVDNNKPFFRCLSGGRLRKVILAVMFAFFGETQLSIAQSIQEGCYHRDYSDNHLRTHPDQVVDWITMRVGADDWGNQTVSMVVNSANQGHAKRSGLGGQEFNQWLICFSDDGTDACAVECDGGSFKVTKQTSDAITFRTSYLLVGDNEEQCGGALDLAEFPNTPVSYRLDLVSDSACDGLGFLEPIRPAETRE